MILEISNSRLLEYLDANKILDEKAKANEKDLLHPLEEIPVMGSYINFGKRFSMNFDSEN